MTFLSDSGCTPMSYDPARGTAHLSRPQRWNDSGALRLFCTSSQPETQLSLLVLSLSYFLNKQSTYQLSMFAGCENEALRSSHLVSNGLNTKAGLALLSKVVKQTLSVLLYFNACLCSVVSILKPMIRILVSVS